jgi:hypothetical protein
MKFVAGGGSMIFRKSNHEVNGNGMVQENAGDPPRIEGLPFLYSRGSVFIAKITIPKSTGISSHKRLSRILYHCRKYPTTRVSAPAGSVKTSLVASYLKDSKTSCIRYRLGERDGDIAPFSHRATSEKDAGLC